MPAAAYTQSAFGLAVVAALALLVVFPAAARPLTPNALKTFLPSCVGTPLYKRGSSELPAATGTSASANCGGGGRTAARSGQGRVYWNDCLPHCFEGHWHSAPGAILRLHGITSCRGYRAFARVRLIAPRGSGVTGVDERRVYPDIC
jgi:hypothetical protein